MHKYGRDFSAAAMENRGGCVSERVSILPAAILGPILPLLLSWQVMRKLVIETPSDQLVDAYLGEIAKAYSVKWAPTSLTTAAAEESVVVCPFSFGSGYEALKSFPKGWPIKRRRTRIASNVFQGNF
jgi:vacuolar protein sorting-associated protein IST1